jgi:hypothetical protein
MSFPLGSIVATRAVYLWAQENEIDLLNVINRHAAKDWGELDADDKRANDYDLLNGGRVLSRYTVQNEALYVITEHDRSSTTLMFVHEY